MKIFVPHSSDFDFTNKLYLPLRSSHLNDKHHFFLPQESGREEITKELIQSCDLILAEVSLPSTGEGIELGWANIAGIPIICMYERGNKISKSLKYITKEFIEYDNSSDMLQRIETYLK